MKENNSRDFPEIDISLVTFNSAGWLEAFFLSLAEQKFPLGSIHLLVRDNGSTDATIALLENIRTEKKDFASFHIESGDNAGFGGGHNANLMRGGSPFFLVCNPDLTFEPEAITKIVAQAMSDEARIASWEFRQKPYEHPKYYDPVTMYTSWSSGACILFRRAAIMQVGGFEPRIFMYGEDVELSYRLRAAGYFLKYCPSSTCWHHTYDAANETKPLQFINSKLGNAYIRLRYGNWLQVMAIVPLFVAALLLPQRFAGQRWRVLKAVFQLLRDAPYFLKGRKAGQAVFPLHRFDYERTRSGAFYEYRPQPVHHPLVSVIIRSRSSGQARLKEALATVLNQTYPNIELIVVEAGSTALQEYLLEIVACRTLTAVRHLAIAEGEHAGNAALAVATGEYLAILDDDALLFADHIEVLVQELQANPQAGAAFGEAWQLETQVAQESAGEYREARYQRIEAQPFSRLLQSHKDCLPIQSILFRSGLYREHGGYDEALAQREDWELALRYSANHDFVPVPKLTSLYRKQGERTA